MPQMAPLSWTLLFFNFILIFILINSMNYFVFKNNPQISIPTKSNLTLTWKW